MILQILKRLFEFEYKKLGIPKPSVVIFLAVDPDVSQKPMTKRNAGDDNKKDIHEKDIEYLRKCREVAKYCRQKIGRKIVQCDKDGCMRTIVDIHEEIVEIVKNTKSVDTLLYTGRKQK